MQLTTKAKLYLSFSTFLTFTGVCKKYSEKTKIKSLTPSHNIINLVVAHNKNKQKSSVQYMIAYLLGCFGSLRNVWKKTNEYISNNDYDHQALYLKTGVSEEFAHLFV